MRVAVLALAAALSGPAVGAGSKAAQDPTDAYTVWLCPMHRDHQSHEPGDCPVCGMALVRRTLVTRYVCLGEEDGFVAGEPGACPDTGEPLVPTTREVVWICPGDSGEDRTEPGVCADGSPAEIETRVAEHGDHNPRHGGILFMAPDGVHHLEGTLEDGRFRLYFYDSFTRPIQPDAFAATAAEADDAGTLRGDPVPLASGDAALEIPVERDPDGRHALTAFVNFPERDGADRFDFIFLPEAELAALREAAPAAGLPELTIPERSDEILEEIRERDVRVQRLIADGRWADLFIPALEAKALALAWGERVPDRPWPALKKIIRGAWLLDLHGDEGDRLRVLEAYEVFAEGMRGLPGETP